MTRELSKIEFMSMQGESRKKPASSFLTFLQDHYGFHFYRNGSELCKWEVYHMRDRNGIHRVKSQIAVKKKIFNNQIIELEYFV